MIRLATLEDLPRLVEMGKRFRSESAYKNFIPENSQKMTETAQKLIELGTVYVSEQDGKLDGMIGFLLFDHPLSGEKTASEIFWWVEPEARGTGIRLLHTMKRAAKQSGAVKMQMIAPSPEVAEIYLRLGYLPIETHFQKSL